MFQKRDPAVQDNEFERSTIPESVSLHYHLTLFSRFLVEYVPTPGEVNDVEWNRIAAQMYWSEPQNTFFLAASIRKVDTHFGIFDDSITWCRPGYEFEKAKDDLISQYMFEATRFMWTWMSLEHVVDKLEPGSESGRHARAVALMQRTRFGGCRETGKLTELLRELTSTEVYSRALFKARSSNVRMLLPFFLCKEIRNAMFHAPIVEIVPTSWGDGDHYNVENDKRVVRIRVAARLVLFIVQEVLIEYLRSSPARTNWDEATEYHVARSGILKDVELWRAIRFIHFTDPYAASRQFDISL